MAAAGRPELTTVAAVAAGRLGGLGPETRRLVEAAAVGDGHLRISLLEQVLDVTPEELDAALGRGAARRHPRRPTVEHDAVGFRHALLREATEPRDSDRVPGASWHRRWAEVLEDNPGVLAADPALLAVAEHWHQAGDVRRALAATVAALPAAARVCRPDEEAALWTRILTAFAVLDDASEVAGMPLRDAYAKALLASGIASHPVRRACMTAAPVDQLPAAMQLIHAMVVFEHGKGEANIYSEDRLTEIADLFEDSAPDLMAVNAWSNTGSLMTEDLARGERLVERARSAARELGDLRASVMVESRDSYRAQVNGDPERAAQRLREALDLFGDERWDGVFHLWGNLVWCELICGRHEEAQQAADEALRRLRHPHLSVNLWEHLAENAAMSWILTGRWRRARELLREEPTPWWEDDVRTSNAHLHLLDLLQTGHASASRGGARQLESPAAGGAPVTDARGVLALAAIAGRRPHRHAGRARPLWADGPHAHVRRPAVARWSSWRSGQRRTPRSQVPRDDRTAAAGARAGRRRRRRCGSVATDRLGEVWPLDLAAQLDRFHGRDARPALRAALEGWERIGHVPDAAVTLLSLAEQEAVHGDRDAARRHLAAGRAVAERLEAAPLLARADALAERWAIGPRERRTDGVLTEREVEVLRLVAEGMTNGQIGVKLFMSPKTASVHVSHILAKLGAANRTEAAATARRQGLLG